MHTGQFTRAKRAAAALAGAIVLFASTASFAAEHEVLISGFAFEPTQLEVAAGDTVTFTNADAVAHTATAQDGSFDTGLIGQGESATITITEAGTFEYACTPHPSMTASIVAR